MTAPRLGVAVALAALALAGCGGDGPTREEFAQDAEQLCVELQRQSDELSKAQPDSVEEVVEFTDRARATTEDAVERIQGLEVPEGDEGDKAEEWQAAVTDEAENQLIPALEQLKEAARANDRAALAEAAQRIEGLQATRSDELARELGADGCAD